MPSPRRSRAALIACACVLAASCLPGPRPPVAPIRGALSFAPAPAVPAPDDGPLRVVFAAPQGEAAGPVEITLVLSKPLRALDAGGAPAAPPRITPPVQGKWQWVGSRALRFEPAAPLPRATAFRVELPAGLRALDGSTLGEAHSFSFTTPRPALLSVDPALEEGPLPPDAVITLHFNQPIASEEIRRAVSLRAGRGGKELAFTVVSSHPGDIELHPSAPLPLDSELRLQVDASLRAEEGAIPLGKAFEASGRSISPPRVLGWSCPPHPVEAGACEVASRQVLLRFNNPVSFDQLDGTISIEPPLPFDIGYSEDEKTIPIFADFEPAKSYRFKLDSAKQGKRLSDKFGQAFSAVKTGTLRFGDLAPDLSFGARGTYWLPARRHALPVFATNLSQLSLGVKALGLEQVLARLAGQPDPPLPSGAAQITPKLPARNAGEHFPLQIEDLLPGAGGPVLVQASYGVDGVSAGKSATREVQITSLGIDTKISPEALHVWVNRLDTADPVSGAAVSIHRVPAKGAPPGPAALLASSLTGPKGTIDLPLTGLSITPGERVAVVVRSGSEWAYRTLEIPRPPERMGLIFSERGIYRPGETVWLKGIFRDPSSRGLLTPRGQAITVEVIGPEGETVDKWTPTLSNFGTFERALALPAGAHLGFYHFTVSGIKHLYGRFLVAEYQPTEIAVEARLDHPAYVRGDVLACEAEGRYLHGSPMTGATASLTLTRANGGFSIAGLDGFEIHDQNTGFPVNELGGSKGAVGPEGTYRFPLTLSMPNQRDTESVSCQVEIADLNQHTLAASAEAIVHPGEVYVALELPAQRSLHPGERLHPRALTVEPGGARRSMPVRLELVKVEGPDGVSPKESVVGGCDLTTGEAPAGCELVVPRGPFAEDSALLVRGSTRDPRGNRVAAAYRLFVESAVRPPPPAPPPPSPPPPPPEPRLVVSTPRRVAVGQTGVITIQSPFSTPATAWITLEREGVLWQRFATIPSTGAAIEFPVTPELMPGAEVSVRMVSGRVSRSESTRIEVDTASRELKLILHPSSFRPAPGAEIDVDIEVDDAAGRPAHAEVTLFAADEGSLSLIYYRTPHPHDDLFRERSSLVRDADARDELLSTFTGRHRSSLPTVRMGATQSSGAARGDFRQTVVFEGHLITDASGHVHRKVKLPDGLTAYRFMAVAVAEDDRFGSTAVPIVTRKPLMARPSLPLVVRAGDRFEASLILSTTGLPDGPVEVQASAEGLVLEPPTTRSLDLRAEVPAELRFPVRAERGGPARLTFRATTRGDKVETDAVELRREVVVPTRIETATLHGDTDRAVAEQLGDLRSFRDDLGGLSLTLSPSPLASLAGGIEQLIQYPHGCTEQTVSRMIPLLSLRELAASLAVELPADVPGALARAIAQVTENQQPDGGFGLWPSSRQSEPWISAYALWGLGEARRRGYAVPEVTLEKGRAHLRRQLDALSSAGSDAQLAQAAFVVDLLAEEGKLPRAPAARLFSERARLPLFARALLLHAFALGKEDPASIAALVQEIEGALRIDGALARAVTTGAAGFSALLDSDLRTSAMVLRALLAARPDHPLAHRLAAGLLADRRGDHWRTTQETAWALLALDAYRRAAPPAPPDFDARVFLGQSLVIEAPFHGAGARPVTRFVPMQGLAGGREGLTFSLEGAGRLHYEARLRFARKEPLLGPQEAGFFVQKSMRLVGAPRSGPAPSSFALGSLVLCEIEVVTPLPRDFVVIDDPLPGGLVVADPDLRKGSSLLRSLEQDGASRRELRDDRVVYFVDHLPAGVSRYTYVARASSAGTFGLPPSRVEEMYVPETFGATGATTVQITGK